MEALFDLSGIGSRLLTFFSGQAPRLMVVAGFLLCFVLAERICGRDWRKYARRGARTDGIYTLLALTGLYSLVFWLPVYGVLDKLLTAILPALPLELTHSWPPALQLGAFLIAGDFFAYWTHRAMHASPSLWAFHSIHHSQVEPTVLTSYRFHFVDTLLLNFVFFAVSRFLSLPVATWLLVMGIVELISCLQHANLDWGYGPLDSVLISPRYHSIHHSLAAEHRDRNFAMLFSFWDRIFGTAVEARRLPAAYGVAGDDIPEAFFSQMVLPFDRLRRTMRGE
ncbi:MAG TPA: sterol desaturase family protein [Thermoanaerobaculia bacterium]|nr:sterol desaturase family protein [Thermoanaerobaculia bacterium]